MHSANSYHGPSLWPARREKRHAAVSRDFASIEARLLTLENQLGKLDEKLDSLLCRNSTSVPDRYPTSDIDELSTRLDRMETLLFRLPVAGFEQLDAAIAVLLPNTRPKHVLLSAEKKCMEQEIEKSPGKSTVPSSCGTAKPEVLPSDIASEPDSHCESSTVWEPLPDTVRVEHVSEPDKEIARSTDLSTAINLATNDNPSDSTHPSCSRTFIYRGGPSG